MKLVKLNGIWKKIVPSYSVFGSSGVVREFAGPADKIPDGWLLCDGAEYSVHDYTNLYDVIGNTYGGTEGSTFRVPDYRECVLVGAGQNETDAVVTHDEYAVGEFKDDQLQQMSSSSASFPAWSGSYSALYTVSYGNVYGGEGARNSGYEYAHFDSARVARSGTTTHGKQKGVNYIIHV